MSVVVEGDLADRLALRGVVPVVALETPDEGVRLAEVLVEAGLPVIEVTFRTDAAAAAIAAITARVPEILVGAGTLLTPESVGAAVDAGAAFGVAPGLRAGVVGAALDRGLPFAPGVATASEIEQGLALGLDFFKLFPAEASGGLALLDAFAGPYANVRFMPTGGIRPDTLAAYRSRSNVAACGGTWIAPRSLLDEGAYDEISRRAVAAVHAAAPHSFTRKDI